MYLTALHYRAPFDLLSGSRKYAYPPHMEGYWKFQKSGFLEVKFPRGVGVRRVTFFQREQEHCPRETFQYRKNFKIW